MKFAESIIANNKKLMYFAFLVGILFSFSRVIRHFDYYLAISYFAFSVLLFFNVRVFIEKELRSTLVPFLGFIIWGFFTVFWAQSSVISLIQSFYFLFVILIAILIVNYTIKKQISFWEILFISNIILIILNTLSLIFEIPQDAWTANHGMGFTGIFKHQNSLASALLFTLPGVFSFFFYFFEKRFESISHTIFNKTIIKKKAFLFVVSMILVLNIFLIILSHSRASLISFTIGVIVYCIITIKTKLFKKIIFSTLLLLPLLIVFNGTIVDYLQKGNPSYFSTREVIWGASYKAAKEHLFFGSGFGNSNENIIIQEGLSGSKYIFGKYFREKGNGFLAIVEESGIIGLLFFFLPIVIAIKKVFFSIEKLIWQDSLALSSIFAFVFHLQFESWISSFYFTPRLIFFIILAWLLQKKTQTRLIV